MKLFKVIARNRRKNRLYHKLVKTHHLRKRIRGGRTLGNLKLGANQVKACYILGRKKRSKQDRAAKKYARQQSKKKTKRARENATWMSRRAKSRQL